MRDLPLRSSQLRARSCPAFSRTDAVTPEKFRPMQGSAIMDQATVAEIDKAMMERCIALSRTAKQDGEFPFACVIARDGKVIVETTNRVARDGDLTRHAEIVAVGMA